MLAPPEEAPRSSAVLPLRITCARAPASLARARAGFSCTVLLIGVVGVVLLTIALGLLGSLTARDMQGPDGRPTTNPVGGPEWAHMKRPAASLACSWPAMAAAPALAHAAA
jgi:hypothetical protein